MKRLGDIKFYDVAEISRLFDLTPQTVRRFFKDGRIRAQKFGSKWYVTEEAMREFLMGESKKE